MYFHPVGTVQYRSVMVKYVSNNQTRRLNIIKAIKLNSKVVVAAQGVKDDNKFTLQVSKFTKVSEMSSRQVNSSRLSLLADNLTHVRKIG